MEALQTKPALPRYPAYKPSGVDWLGEVPEGWEVVRFRNFFSFSRGLTITKADLKDSGIPCVNYGEVHSKYGFELDLAKHPLKFVDAEFLRNSPNSLLTKGDIVFADTSEDIEGSGNFTQLISDGVVLAGYHTIIARPKPSQNFRFIAYVLESTTYRNQIRRAVKGVKVYSISSTLLKNTLVWFPPLPEQTAIAHFLDEKTAKIDRAVAQKERMIALLKERKQIIIQNAVTKGVTSGGVEKPVKMKDSGVEWIGEVPEGWEVKKLKYIGRIQSGDPIINSQLSELDDYEVFGGNGLMGYTNRFNTSGKKIIIGRVGALCGNVRLIQISKWVSDNALILTLKKDSCYEFFAILLEAANLNSLNSSNAQPLITGTKVMNYPIPTPPGNEQKEIAHHIKTQSTRMDKAMAQQQQQIEKLKEYKAVLVDSAVRGKVKVGQ